MISNMICKEQLPYCWKFVFNVGLLVYKMNKSKYIDFHKYVQRMRFMPLRRH